MNHANIKTEKKKKYVKLLSFLLKKKRERKTMVFSRFGFFQRVVRDRDGRERLYNSNKRY